MAIEDLHSSVDRVAHADAPQIEPHGGLREHHSTGIGCQPQGLSPNRLTGRGQLPSKR